MLDRNLILSGLPIGLIGGVAAWMAFGRDMPQADALDLAVTALRTRAAGGPEARANLSVGVAPPLFATPQGAAATAEVNIVLQGLTRTPHRQAALVSIAGRPAEWLTVGETRDDVTLESVRTNGATITTPSGPRDITFGAVSVSAPPAQPAQPEVSATLRMPPAPASAPETP